MQYKKSFFYALAFIALFATCQPKVTSTSKNANALPANALVNNGIMLVPVSPPSPAFETAKLALKNLPNGSVIADTGKLKFDFDVQNYQLGNQTPDATQKKCANSTKGQHIHLILNNEPYTAHYTPEITQTIKKTGNYVALAFLSRSYHESLKHKQAYTLTQFSVGKNLPPSSFDSKAPHLFYSRPKGEYIGEADIENILLDFFLVNTELAKNGNKVRVTINNKATFTLTQWQPYLIKGLSEGENTVKLELLNAKNELVQSPFNPVQRTFKLFKSEPIKP